MIKVLLADDEQWIVDNLKVSVEWAKYGFEVVDTALDGIEAYEKIMEWQPQLVFTDIRMPGMNGLELIKKVGATHPEIQFAVISGFVEFAYAQKAIQYGAIGYCLKPVEDQDVIQVLEKARASQTGNSRSEVPYAGRLEASDIRSDQSSDLHCLIERMGLNLSEIEGLQVIAAIGTGPLSFSHSEKAFACDLGPNKNVYLIPYRHPLQPKDYLTKEIGPEIRGVGFARVNKQGGQLARSIEEAVAAAYQFFIAKGETSFVFEDILTAPPEFYDLFSNLQHSLKKSEFVNATRLIDELETVFRAGGLSILHAYRIYNLVVSMNSGDQSLKEDEYIPNFEKLVDRFDDVYAMLGELKEYLISCMDLTIDPEVERLMSETVKAILKYIRTHFYKVITLGDISAMFNINPSYLSQLFKKETGQNLIEYITRVRMEHACMLLKTSSLTVNSIAEQSGYEDNVYFRKVFRKVIGKTPGEYRNS